MGQIRTLDCCITVRLKIAEPHHLAKVMQSLILNLGGKKCPSLKQEAVSIPVSFDRPGNVSPGIEPSGVVFPSQNNNNILRSFSVLQPMWELEFFSSAQGQL